jgi:hypothetical protein
MSNFHLYSEIRVNNNDNKPIPYLLTILHTKSAAAVVYWSEFLATDPEVSGSIPGATRFSGK